MELSINVKNIIYKIMITSTVVTRLSCYGILMLYIMKSQILNINPFTHIDKTGGWISFKKNVYSARLKRIVKDELLCGSWNLLNAHVCDCVIAWLHHAITRTTTSVTIICIIYLSEKQNELSNSRKQKQGLQQVISVAETANVDNFAPFLASKL